VLRQMVDDRQPDRIAQAIQHDRQFHLVTGRMSQGSRHDPHIPIRVCRRNVQYLLN
jgi:hypothetical protein